MRRYSKMKRWSKLQSRLYNVMIKDFQIHVAKYKMNGLGATTNELPRYWITFGKEIIFDYPAMMLNKGWYPFTDDMSNISNIIEDYLNCNKENLIEYTDSRDVYGLLDILKSCDRRIGQRRLLLLSNVVQNEYALRIIEKRCKGAID